ncbi:MAG: hypothetical protein K2Q10_01240 [Rhodospirillales bacterium]|nr:hypothetical protein [Rhodospirillales bacterium]
MPKETRRILFSPAELNEAMSLLATQSKFPMPPGTLDRVVFDPAKEPALVLTRRIVGSVMPQMFAFRKEEVAAGLILYCRSHKIPLPRNSRRSLVKHDDGAIFVIES